MFTYHSKRLQLGSDTSIHSLAWHSRNGVLAVGGDLGLIKLLTLNDTHKPNQEAADKPKVPSLALQGEHTGRIVLLNWNEYYRKLTSVCNKGTMIIWRKSQDTWVEEMVNNSGKNLITDVQWSADGTKLCILIEDGQMIVGSVDGERLWNLQIANDIPSIVEWSPDNKHILVGTKNGEVMVFDMLGNHMHSINLICFPMQDMDHIITSPGQKLAALEWFHGAKTSGEGAPASLIIAYECGKIQLSSGESDSNPILIETAMAISAVKWNPQGTFFAVAGTHFENDNETAGVVQFYNNHGIYIKFLKTNQSSTVTSVSWHGTGLKLALGVGKFMFLANCKFFYKMAYLKKSKTFVFSIERENRVDFCLVFYSLTKKTMILKYIRYLRQIHSYGDSCAIVCRSEDSEERWNIQLCNSAGNPIETKMINIEPMFIEMTKNHIIVANSCYVYVWNYKTSVASRDFMKSTDSLKFGKEVVFKIDQKPEPKEIYDCDNYPLAEELPQEDISCITANETTLIIGLSHGIAKRYSLPHLMLEKTIALSGKPDQLRINNNGKKMAMIDYTNVLTFYELKEDSDEIVIDFEKKDVWSVVWSKEDPDHCVFLEKYRLFFKQGAEVTNVISTDSYIVDFSHMEAMTVDIEEIIAIFNGEEQDLSEYFLAIKAPKLDELEKMIESQKFEEAFLWVTKNSHSYLWEFLAERCLLNLDFKNADRAFVEYDNYAGLKFSGRVQQMDNKVLQRAEVYAFFGKFEEARELLIQAERKDLAIQLLTKTGDYERMMELVMEGAGSDKQLNDTYDKLGEFFEEQLDWEKASHFYNLAKNEKAMIEAFFRAGKYKELGKLANTLTDKNLLISLGEKLEGLGMCGEAAKAYEKAGDVKRGIDCCILYNYWSEAVELAERNNMVQIDGLISKYAKMLLDNNRKLEAVELYRKANRNTEAALLLNKLANELIDRDLSPLMIKKVGSILIILDFCPCWTRGQYLPNEDVESNFNRANSQQYCSDFGHIDYIRYKHIC